MVYMLKFEYLSHHHFCRSKRIVLWIHSITESDAIVVSSIVGVEVVSIQIGFATCSEPPAGLVFPGTASLCDTISINDRQRKTSDKRKSLPTN